MDELSSTSLVEDLDIRLSFASLKLGIPLYTDIKSQYCKQTDNTFQSARKTADAVNEMKLIMKPETTGANSLQVRSILLIIEFIFVKTPGDSPSDITTTLEVES